MKKGLFKLPKDSATAFKDAAPVLGLAILWPFFRANCLSFVGMATSYDKAVIQGEYAAFSLAFMVISILVVLFADRIGPLVQRPFFAYAPAAAGVLGFVLLWLPLDPGVAMPAGTVGSLLIAAYYIATLLRYIFALERCSSKRAAIIGFASFGLSFLGNLLYALPATVQAAFFIASPIVTAACVPRQSGDSASAREGSQNADCTPRRNPALSAPIALMLLLAAFCLAGNLVRGVTDPWFNYSGPTFRSVVMTTVNIVIAGVSIALLARNVRVNRVLFWNWAAFMSLFFGGMLLLSFAPGDAAKAGSDIVTVARVVFTLLMLLFALQGEEWFSLSSIRRVGLFLLIPESIAAVVRFVLIPLLYDSPLLSAALVSSLGIVIIFALMIAIVIVLGMLLLRQTEVPHGKEDDPDRTAEQHDTAPFDSAMAQVTQLYSLTAREAQTASFISRGYSLEKTADVLGISINTVRTHMRSVYSKLDIHSRQDLIDVLEHMDGR